MRQEQTRLAGKDAPPYSSQTRFIRNGQSKRAVKYPLQLLLSYKVNLSKKDKHGLQAQDVGGEYVSNLISKAKRFDVISKMNFKKGLDAEKAAFKSETDFLLVH